MGAPALREGAGSRQNDDRKPAKTKTAARVVKDQLAGIVRAAMRHHVAHRSDQRALDIPLRRSVFPDSADAAHYLFSIADCRLLSDKLRFVVDLTPSPSWERAGARACLVKLRTLP